MKTLIIDNYDSFTYNLYQYIGELKGNPVIYLNNKISLSQIKKLKPDRIIISPGPGNPEDPAYFGVCLDTILKLGPTIPLLGICLGHQGIIYAFGGRIINAPRIMHGKTSIISHNQKDIFNNVQNPLEGMRYHSLVGSPVNFPKDLKITAEVVEESTKQKNTIMGVRHVQHPIFGIQFHPESIGTIEGRKILRNFLFLTETKKTPSIPKH